MTAIVASMLHDHKTRGGRNAGTSVKYMDRGLLGRSEEPRGITTTTAGSVTGVAALRTFAVSKLLDSIRR